MATTVYDVEEIQLQDGKKLTLKPLSIRDLRRFMEVMGKTSNTQTEDEALSVLIEACGIVIEKAIPEVKENKEMLEDLLDIPTINRIIKVCGGIDLEDPNLLIAAQQQAQAGAN